MKELTKAEKDIIEQVSYGKTNRQIAFRRRVSHYTVKNQLSTLYRKLGVSCRAELTRWYLTEGKEN